jgi:hypothetical protein
MIVIGTCISATRESPVGQLLMVLVQCHLDVADVQVLCEEPRPRAYDNVYPALFAALHAQGDYASRRLALYVLQGDPSRVGVHHGIADRRVG